MERKEILKIKETVKWLWKEANKKRNREDSNILWYIGEGTSGRAFIYASKDKVTCYMNISKNGNYGRPTFTLITKKYPYGTSAVGYREALELLEYDLLC